MNITGVTVIIVCSYMIGEIYKVIFSKKQEVYKLIPIILAITGGAIGILIFITNPEILLDANNIWIALFIGIVSGTSSTGTNQIVKQLFKKEGDLNGEGVKTKN